MSTTGGYNWWRPLPSVVSLTGGAPYLWRRRPRLVAPPTIGGIAAARRRPLPSTVSPPTSAPGVAPYLWRCRVTARGRGSGCVVAVPRAARPPRGRSRSRRRTGGGGRPTRGGGKTHRSDVSPCQCWQLNFVSCPTIEVIEFFFQPIVNQTCLTALVFQASNLQFKIVILIIYLYTVK